MRCSGCLNRIVDLMLGRVQMFFRLCAVPSHIVVVRRAGVLHLFDRFERVVVGRVQVVPIMNPVGNRDSGNE